MFVDNRYVAGSSTPIARRDAAGNTYQLRRLDDGSSHEVLKNFPSPADVREGVTRAGAMDVRVEELPYYWYTTYHAR
jgi:demethylmenaquinone methyltransferase/2-methoxy-6-polyprenyl-1,4-benzoquinol methylase